MILGIGVDIVETARIARALQREGFIRRVFCDEETAYCAPMKFSERHFAARFAAKEAIAKAFGTGIGSALGWRDMEIARTAEGAPFVILHGNGRELAEQLGVREVRVSLSHCRDYAVANALLVGVA